MLAAAVRARADAVVTFNLKHFRGSAVQLYGIEIIPPDDFLLHQIHLDRARFERAFQSQIAALRDPPLARAELLDALRPLIPATVEEIAATSG